MPRVARLDIPGYDGYLWSGHAVLMGNRQMDGQVLEEVLQFFGENVFGPGGKYRRFNPDRSTTGHPDDLVRGGLRRGKEIRDDFAERHHFDPRVLGSGTFVDSLLRNEILRKK